ncbi:hypothetical protein [Streptomyces sp. NPDC096033]|uniref:hypothetical protein n=1 Tax=Streptomyces sp. NPDC096033 TaxID=3366071 RepID=UPI00382BA2FC
MDADLADDEEAPWAVAWKALLQGERMPSADARITEETIKLTKLAVDFSAKLVKLEKSDQEQVLEMVREYLANQIDG